MTQNDKTCEMKMATLTILGPGGVGKTFVERLVRPEVASINPSRLRSRPRDRAENGGEPDLFYGHRDLRSQLSTAFVALGDVREILAKEPETEWFPGAGAGFFKVRDEWQALLLGKPRGGEHLAKIEIYAPALRALLRGTGVRDKLGKLTIVLLNPVTELRPLNRDFSALKTATASHCELAGRSAADTAKRVNSIDEEAYAWLDLLDQGAIEFPMWPFPEHCYRGKVVSTLLEARRRLVTGCPGIERFLIDESQIAQGNA